MLIVKGVKLTFLATRRRFICGFLPPLHILKPVKACAATPVMFAKIFKTVMRVGFIQCCCIFAEPLYGFG